MTPLLRPFTLIVLLAGGLAAPVLADPHKDESGHGRGKGQHAGREYKDEYWDGRCKVERKWEKSGEYKEERKCKGQSSHARQYDAPYYAAPQQPGVIVEPPTVVIQPRIVVRP
jgi:hypothetical protein